MAKGLKSVQQLKDDAVLEGWLFSILNNCLRNHSRRLHPQPIEEIMELPAGDFTPEQHHAESELIDGSVVLWPRYHLARDRP